MSNEFELIQHEGRETWRELATGRLAPVIRGASDLGAADAGAGGGDLGGGGEAPIADPAGAAPAGGAPAGGEQTFSPGYVEQLRRESAGYRTKAQTYEQAFDGYDEDAQGALLDFAKALRNDPAAAAQFAREIYQSIEQQQQQAQIQGEQPLTRAEFDQMMQERETAQQNQLRQYQTSQQVAEISKTVAGLGYNPNAQWTADNWQEAADHMNVLALATYVYNGDIQAAHEAMQGRGTQAIGQYVQQRTQDARNNPLPVGGRGGPAASAPQNNGLTGWDAANAQIQQMLGNG